MHLKPRKRLVPAAPAACSESVRIGLRGAHQVAMIRPYLPDFIGVARQGRASSMSTECRIVALTIGCMPPVEHPALYCSRVSSHPSLSFKTELSCNCGSLVKIAITCG